MTEGERLASIHDAFIQRQFVRDWSASEVVTYEGVLDPTCLKVRVAVEIADIDLVNAPLVRLLDPTVARRQIPHVLTSNLSLCYYEPSAIVLDRYDPGGSILQCLDRAEKVLRDGINGRLDADFVDEFLSYWSNEAVYVDLPPAFEGMGVVRFVSFSEKHPARAILSGKDSWLFSARPDRGHLLPEGEPCRVVRTKRSLTVNPVEPWQSDSLISFNDWLRWVDPSLVGRLEKSFVGTTGIAHWLAIAAINGLFLARIAVPPSFQTKEFTKTRRVGLPALLGRIAGQVPVERSGGYRADVEYIFGRNMGDVTNLGGKRVLLVGCGTIGGFLAHQLAQAGAGTAGGRLTLMDTDTVRTANLGRHLLGVPYLGRNKAEACRDFLLEQLPMLDVVSKAEDVLAFGPPMHLFDLVIDATGEEALSITLNDRAVRARPASPAILFCWLVGNGAAAQCILTGEAAFACFKCLKTDLAGEPRYRTLRKDVEVVHQRYAACGDPHFIPFPVSRSAAASALACEAALDWANAKPEPRFRSTTLDRTQAYQVKDANPAKSRECPACGGRL